MTKDRSHDHAKNRIIALAKAKYGEITQVSIVKAAGELLYDPLMESPQNIHVICAHLQQFPLDNPENFAQKAYGFAKRKKEAEMLEGLKQSQSETEYLDGSKVPEGTSVPGTNKAEPPQPIKQESKPVNRDGIDQKNIIVEKPTVRPQEGVKAKADKQSSRRPSLPNSTIDKYTIKAGLTSLGITAESTYKINSTKEKSLQIKKIVGLSPRLDPKKNEVRIVSGMGLLEGTINNGDFVKDGYVSTISKNGRDVYVIDLPERVGVLLPKNKGTHLQSSVSKKLAEYVLGLKNPTEKNLIDAVQKCNKGLTRVGSTFNIELKLMIFPVPTKNKTI